MADTNEWSVFLMAALPTFSCCVASLNIPSLSQSSPCKATELKTVSAHIYGWRYHHGNAWTKKLKDKKKEKYVSHKTETTRRCLLSFRYFSDLLNRPFKHISPFPFISSFPLSHKIPCSHFFPGRGINSGLSVRRCVEWQSHGLFDSPGDWPFHCLRQHTCYLALGRQRRERKREKDWVREVGISGGGFEKD